MIPEGIENHIADSKSDNENEFLKIKENLLRDELAKKEGSPYHETSEARVLAFTNGWNACRENEHIGKLIKKWGEAINEKSKLQSTIEEAKKENEILRQSVGRSGEDYLLEINRKNNYITALKLTIEEKDKEIERLLDLLEINHIST